MSDNGNLCLLFVSEVFVIVHFTGYESVGSRRNSIFKQK